jgi:histidyl-tRNA synthetase
MREANRMGVQFVVILGDKELEKGIAVVKNMDTGDQEQLTLEELPHYFVVDGHQ